MLDIKLDNYKLPNTYIRNGNECFLDPIREKLILKTPEEIVRQKVIKFLEKEMKVPKNMIDVELPMSYYRKGAKGRADIIVSTINDNKKLVPILVVECKAPDIPLTDNVFHQVIRYDKIIFADTILVTNGKQFVIECYDSEDKKYKKLQKLPTYKELIHKNNLVFIDNKNDLWERPKFEDFEKREVIKEFISYGSISENTNKELIPFIINLMGLFLDNESRLKPQVIEDVNIVKDGGIRYTSFSNSSGGSWPGLYRYFIIEDKNGDNQIISLSIFSNDGFKNHPKYGNRSPKSIIIVAIDDFENSHNSLQLNLNRFIKKNNKKYKIYHNGALTVGNLGRAKNKEVIDFINDNAPNLINEGKIFLGELINSKEFKWNQNQVKNFIGRIIRYALLRDKFRVIKKNAEDFS